MRYIFLFIQISPILLIAALIGYELLIYRLKQNAESVLKLYGGGFLSKKSRIFHIAILFFLVLYLLLTILGLIGAEKLSITNSLIGFDYSNLFLLCCFILIITNTLHVYASNSGLFIGADIVAWDQVKHCSIHAEKTVGHKNHFLTIHLVSDKHIKCLINQKNMNKFMELLQENHIQLSSK